LVWEARQQLLRASVAILLLAAEVRYCSFLCLCLQFLEQNPVAMV